MNFTFHRRIYWKRAGIILGSRFVHFFLIFSEENTIRLIALGTRQGLQNQIKCRNQDNEVVDAQFHVLDNVEPCKWWNYLIDCKFEQPSTSLQLINEEPVEVSQASFKNYWHSFSVWYCKF